MNLPGDIYIVVTGFGGPTGDLIKTAQKTRLNEECSLSAAIESAKYWHWHFNHTRIGRLVFDDDDQMETQPDDI